MAGLLSLALPLALPGDANAQTTTGQFELHQYQPSPFSDRWLRLDGTHVQPSGEFRLGIDLDYALRPLVLVDAMPGIFQVGAPGPEHHLVEHAASASLAASVGLGHGLELALSLPLTLYQSGDPVPGVTTPSLVGAGNPRIGLKAHLLAGKGFGLGAAVLVSPPFGYGALTYEKGLGAEGRVFADVERGRFSAGARVGLRLRNRIEFYDVAVGNELGVAGGVAFRLFPRTSLLAELSGSTAASKPFSNLGQSPIEVLGGLRQRIGKNWLTLAAGPGLTDGYGSPIFRVVAGWTWANRPPDADHDGIPDDDDRCPTVPEDRDGFEDADGCPDPDNDKDGILDASDKCPLEPETGNGFEDEDGCPDVAPGAVDSDKDGILDDDDECPEEAEDKDGFEDEDGCPDPDNDKDGILDADDKCPLEPETINGIDDSDGCPDEGKPDVRLAPHEIETLKPIFFTTDRSRVRHAFYSMLGQVASLMKAHPEIGRVAVEGHTDDTGPADWNQRLSLSRAESVVEFLVKEGVARDRLLTVGQAEKLPWVSNDTPWGRARNRRVVFHVEGANPAEEKKQEARRERRRHIHRHQVPNEKGDSAEPADDITSPAEKRPATPKAREPAPSPAEGAPPAEKRPATPKAREPAPSPAEGAPPAEKRPATPKAREPAEGAPPAEKAAPRPNVRERPPGNGAGEKPAETGKNVRKDDVSKGPAPRTRPQDLAAEARALEKRRGAESGPGAADDAAESEDTADEEAPSPRKPRRKGWLAPPQRPAPRPLWVGPAPTLRELLVLPPK